MKACEQHDDVIVIYNEILYSYTCPLCEKERKFSELEVQFDELEKKNAGLEDEAKEMSRIIDEKGLV